MSEDKDIVIAFDLYGTLLDTSTIATKLGEHFGKEKGDVLAKEWRKNQLEYTWRLNSMGQYLPFSEVTRRSLEETIATAGLELTGSITSDLMHAYDSLSVFPDVPRTLDTLSSIAGVKAVIFTNGTESMASNSVNKSPDLSAHAKVFEQVVVVEAVQKFKPDPATYHHLRRRLNKQEESVDRIWLVSGNPFDIVGSRSLGLNAIWVDRQQSGWHDALIAGESGRPTAIVNKLQDVLKIATG